MTKHLNLRQIRHTGFSSVWLACKYFCINRHISHYHFGNRSKEYQSGNTNGLHYGNIEGMLLRMLGPVVLGAPRSMVVLPVFFCSGMRQQSSLRYREGSNTTNRSIGAKGTYFVHWRRAGSRRSHNLDNRTRTPK